MADSGKAYDLGRSRKREGVSPTFAGEEASPTSYPGLSLSSKEFPPLTDWKVGQTYELTVKVKMVGLHEHEKEMCGEFDVLSASEA